MDERRKVVLTTVGLFFSAFFLAWWMFQLGVIISIAITSIWFALSFLLVYRMASYAKFSRWCRVNKKRINNCSLPYLVKMYHEDIKQGREPDFVFVKKIIQLPFGCKFIVRI